MSKRIAAYWRSDRSNVHGLLLFLSGSAGMTAMQLMHVPDFWAKLTAGVAMTLGALLFTPSDPPAAPPSGDGSVALRPAA